MNLETTKALDKKILFEENVNWLKVQTWNLIKTMLNQIKAALISLCNTDIRNQKQKCVTVIKLKLDKPGKCC